MKNYIVTVIRTGKIIYQGKSKALARDAAMICMKHGLSVRTDIKEKKYAPKSSEVKLTLFKNDIKL